MKFQCRQPETYTQQKARLSNWHGWFAWRPVRVGDNDCRWLEVVERRGTFYARYDDHGYIWEYRPASFQGLLP